MRLRIDNQAIQRWGEQELISEMTVEMYQKELTKARLNQNITAAHTYKARLLQATADHDRLLIICSLYQKMGVLP